MLFEFLIALGGFIVSMIIAGWVQNATQNRRFDRVNERFDRVNERLDRMNERSESILQILLNENSKLRGEISELRGEVSELRGEVGELRGDISVLNERVARQDGLIRAVWLRVYQDDPAAHSSVLPENLIGVPVS